MALVNIFFSMFSGGCGSDIVVGDTTVIVTEEAFSWTWPDLPEALESMQSYETVPETWEIHIQLNAPWRVIRKPGCPCWYYQHEARITARVFGELTMDGCLPHELAHRVRHMEDGLKAAELHDVDFNLVENDLRRLASDTKQVRERER